MSDRADPMLLDEGDPRAAPRGFRRALAQYATGVAVITAEAAGRQAFVTVNSFASVSLDPPLVLWSLRRESTSLTVFEAAGHFAVNVLSAGQVGLAGRFAKSSPEGERVEGLVAGAGGAPLLPDVAAVFECRRTVVHPGGDHLILIGEVERFRCYDRAGLSFAQGRYALAVDLPGGGRDTAANPAAPALPDHLLAPLLLRAYAVLSAEFDRQREALGLDLDQGKALIWLAAQAGAAPASVAQATLLGVSAAEDAVAALLGKGLVAMTAAADKGLPGAVAITSAGQDLVTTLLGRAEAYERARLSGLDADAVRALRRVLEGLADAAPSGS